MIFSPPNAPTLATRNEAGPRELTQLKAQMKKINHDLSQENAILQDKLSKAEKASAAMAQELADLRYSVDDLMEQLRINGIFDLREVDYAVAETTGQLSVRKKAQYETLNAQTLQIQLTPQPVPVLVINDRKILDQGLKACGLTEGAFKKILKKEGYRSEDIFLMTCTPQLDYYIVPMNKR